MSNLLNTEPGRLALIEAQQFLLRRRLARFFKRNTAVEIDRYRAGSQEFDLGTMLGALNPAHDSELLDIYRLLAVTGGLKQTIGDLEFWIDSANGSDITGTGSQARPYASPWFLQTMSPVISHYVRLLFVADNELGDLDLSRFVVTSGGFLSFIGVSAPEVVSGPFTADTITALSAGVGHGNALAAPAWLDDALNGNFIQKLDNQNIGWAMPIHLNTTDTIFYRYTSWNFQAADTYQIIRPALNLGFDSLTLKFRTADVHAAATATGSRVGFFNLNLVQNSDARNQQIVIDAEGDLSLHFVRLFTESSDISIRSRVNSLCPADVAIESLSLSGIPNICPSALGMGPFSYNGVGFILLDDNPAPPQPTSWVVLSSKAEVWAMDTRWKVILEDEARIKYCATGEIDMRYGHNLWALTVFSVSTDDGRALIQQIDARARIDNLAYILAPGSGATAFITFEKRTSLTINNAGADATFGVAPTYAMIPTDVGLAGNWNALWDVYLASAPTLMVGSVADFLSLVTGPQSWPLADAGYQDILAGGGCISVMRGPA